MEVNREWIQDPRRVKQKTSSFYESLYREDVGFRTLLNGMPFDYLSKIEDIILKRPFSEEEIYGVIKDKASRPDAFSIVFFQRCWDIMKNNLLKVFANFLI